MTRLRLPTTLLLAGLFVGTSCDPAYSQHRWVTGEPAEVKQPVVEELLDMPIPEKIRRYAQTLLGQYDANRSGRLELRELSDVRLTIDPRLADVDRDNAISSSELAQFIANYGRYRKIRMPRRPALAEWEEPEPLEPDLALAVDSTENESSSAAETPQEEPTAGSEPEGADISPEGSEPEAAAEDDLTEKPTEGAEADESTATETTPAQAEPVRTLKPSTPQPEAVEPQVSPGGAKYHAPRRRLAGMPDWFRSRDANGDGQVSLAEYSKRPTQATIAQFRQYDRNKDGVITTSECGRVSGGR